VLLVSAICFLPVGFTYHLLDGPNVLWPALIEKLEIQRLDQRGQRQFPWLLPGVGEAAEYLRIQPEFVVIWMWASERRKRLRASTRGWHFSTAGRKPSPDELSPQELEVPACPAKG
jgi:hypothetical protein